jgi:hypothetical protein
VAVCEALEAEGVGAWEGYQPMSRYDLFQPALSRLPVAVEHADRLDPATMSFPVAEDAGLRRTVYLDENVFRAGRRGIEDAVTALAKVQRHAAELAHADPTRSQAGSPGSRAGQAPAGPAGAGSPGWGA